MAGELIGALRVSLGLDSANFESGLKKSRARAQADAKAIQKSLDGLKGRFDALASGIAGSALIAAGKRALDYASSLGEVAQQLGVTTKELQEYRFAASQVGVSNEEMDKGLAKLTRTIGEAAAGSKAQATVFRELGVSVQDVNGRIYSAGEVIPKLADALSRIKDPATRARLEVDLFGKSGQKLDTLLSGGSKAVNELRDAAHRLGIVLSDRQIQNADDTADKLAAVKQVLEARIAGTVADNANAILALANALAVLTAKSVQFINEYPRLAGALAGAAVGARFGGPTGSLIGAGIGYVAGDFASGVGDDANMDLRFRMQKVRDAKAEYLAQKKAATNGGLISFRRGGNGPASGGSPAAAEAELRRQTALLRQATAATLAQRAGGTTISVPDGALPTVAETARKAKGPKGPTAADRAENYQQEIADLLSERAGLEGGITSDVRERARLEHERIATEQAAYEFDIDTKVKAGQLNAADGERLKIANARNSELKDTAVNWELDDQLVQQELEVKRESIRTQLDILSGQSSMARTAKERRDIELKILDHQIELERLAAEAVLASHSATEAEKEIARARLGQLGNVRTIGAANIDRQNQGPMAAYINSFPKTAEEVNERLEAIAVGGLTDVTNELGDMAAAALGLKGSSAQAVAELVKLAIQLASLQFNGGGSGGGGGIFGAIVGGIGSIFGGGNGLNADALASSNLSQLAANNPVTLSPMSLPGYANGGSFAVGGIPGIDKNMLSINGIPRAMVGHNERINVVPAKDRSRMAVEVLPSKYFDVIVRQEATVAAVPVAQNAVAGGERFKARRATRNLLPR